MKVLSIDFDYFVTPTKKQRAFFPDSGTEWGVEVSNVIWASNYATARAKGIEVESCTVDEKALMLVKRIIERQYKKSRRTYFCVADSHAEAYPFIKRHTKKNEMVEVYNIDFHHDTYNYGNQDVDCGNWLRLLLEENAVSKAYWIHQNESKLEEQGRALCEMATIDEIRLMTFDLVFLCRSSSWTPPHLDIRFNELAAATLQNGEAETLENRYDSEFKGAVDAIYNTICSGYKHIAERQLK